MSERANNLITRFNCAKEIRVTWDPHYQEVSDWCEPHNSSIVVQKTPGGKRTTEIFDFTAALAKKKMAAGFFSNLCPLNQRWYMLESDKEDLNKIDDVKMFYMELTSRTHQYIASASSYIASFFLAFDCLGHIGTTANYQFKGKVSPAVCRNIFITKFFYEENSDGIIDVLFLLRELTGSQAIQEFGSEKLSSKVIDAAGNAAKQNEKFQFLQVIMPREVFDPDKDDVLNMPWASTHIEVDAKEEVLESGFNEKPFQVSRFYLSEGETLGRSPAMLILPEIKGLNKTRELTTKNRELLIGPPLMVPTGFMEQIRMIPNALIPYNENSPLKPETLKVGGDIGVANDEISQARQIIREGFFLDLLMTLDAYKQGDQKTAFEVSQILDQVAVVLGPIVGRFLSDMFDGCIVRTIGLLAEAGMFNDMYVPDAIKQTGFTFKIRYISKLALALQAREVNESLDVLMTAADYAAKTQDTSVLDEFNAPKVFRGMAERRAMPVEFFRSDKEKKAIQEGRIEAQKQQQQAEELAAAAKAMPGLGKKPEAGSPGEKVMRAVNAG